MKVEAVVRVYNEQSPAREVVAPARTQQTSVGPYLSGARLGASWIGNTQERAKA